MLKLFLLLCSVLFFPKILKSNTWDWTKYQQNKPSEIYNCTFDKQGNAWLGTSNGLGKFDGKRWSIFNTTNSGLPNDTVTSVAVDDYDVVWVGTLSGGLAEFDGKAWRVFNRKNSGMITITNQIKAIVVSKTNTVWIASEIGLSKFDRDSNTVKKANNFILVPGGIECLAVEGMDTVWVGTLGKGLIKYDGTNIYPYSYCGLNISTIIIDSARHKWISSWDKSLVEYDDVNFIWHSLPRDQYGVTGIGVDPLGNIWVSTYDSIAEYQSYTSYIAVKSSLQFNLRGVKFDKSVVCDYQKNMWITTSKGLTHFNGKYWVTENPDNQFIPANYVNCFALDKSGNMWCGSPNGIGVFNGSQWSDFNMLNTPALMSNAVNAISPNFGGSVTVGTTLGAVKFHDNDCDSALVPYEIYCSATDQLDGSIWLGTANNGVAHIQGGAVVYYDFAFTGLPINSVRSIAIDKNGVKWFGTTNQGLARFDGVNWEMFTSKNSPLAGIPGAGANALAFDKNGVLWIGMSNGVLAKFDGNNWMTYNLTDYGISKLAITSIAIDKNNGVWFGTFGGGLTFFDGKKFQNFTSQNSELPENYITALAFDATSGLWIGTAKSGAIVLKNPDILGVSESGNQSYFALSQIFPNPANEKTELNFTLPTAEKVNIEIFNALGQKISTLTEKYYTAGINQIELDVSGFQSGIYVCHISVGSESKTIKMCVAH